MSRFIVAPEKRDIPVAKCATVPHGEQRVEPDPMTILSLSLLASAYLAEQMRTGND